jgi:hypothetical protein
MGGAMVAQPRGGVASTPPPDMPGPVSQAEGAARVQALTLADGGADPRLPPVGMPEEERATGVAHAGPGEARPPAIPPLPGGQPSTGLPLALSRQLATALAERATERSGSFDMALDPPELGRLRLSFGQLDMGGAITLSIVADRPETADLMRRHIALLAQEFQRAGLDAPQVDISGREGGHQRDAPALPRAAQGPAAPAPQAALPAEAAATLRGGPDGPDGLDMRL